MIRFSRLCALALTLGGTAAHAQAPAAAGSVVVEVTGLKDSSGQAIVSLWNSEDSFLDEDESFKVQKVSIQGNALKVKFDGVPAGSYGICVVHDANKNNELDMGIFPPKPKEGTGCSRDAKGNRGKPKWKDAQITHKGASTTVPVKISYP